MDQLLKTTQIEAVKKGNEIAATIVTLSRKGILFNIGSKAYAALGNREVKEVSTYLPYLKVGGKLTVKVISEESKDGYPVVSMQKFFDQGKWDILKQKKDNEEEIDVICGEYGKGGLFIDFMGIRGVIPKIQLVEKYLNQPEKLNGQKIKVKILEVDREKNRLVVSQKAAVLKISQKEILGKFDKIKVGDTYDAKVLGASEFGIFCEVEGVEGLIHISEISWEKVSNAAHFAKTGAVLPVMVVEKNTNDLKLNLSLKRLQHDPWEKIEEKYPKDKSYLPDKLKGKKYLID